MLAAILFAFVSAPLALLNQATEYVDMLELNHFYDPRGQHVFDQVIFYEQAPETGRFQVRAWCLVEDRELLNRRPVKNITNGLYQVDWLDTDQRLSRKITSRILRESWTQDDPERANKRELEERLRIALIRRSPSPPAPLPETGRGEQLLRNGGAL